MTRLLLLLPTATYRAPDFLAAARALGVDVVVGSEEAPVLTSGALVVPLGDPERSIAAIAAAHATAPFDAVLAVDDQGILVASMAAERLGLGRHNPPSAVAATRDKRALREALDAAPGAVRQPRWAVWTGAESLAVTGLPCVLKPVSLSGSRGVIRADTPDEAVAAVARVRTILADAGDDPAGPVLVESFVPGDEVALEGLLHRGRLDVLALFDKPDPLDGPYFEETLYVTPSRHPDEVQVAVADLAARACAAVGLVEGPVHAEVRLAADGPILLEVAARSIGGLCARSLRFGAGLSLETLIVRHAFGLPTEETREEGASGVLMLPIPRTGVLVAVEGRDDALAVPGVVGLEVTIVAGRTVVALPEGDRYLGFVFARAETPDQVEDALRRAQECLRVVVEPPARP